MTADCSGEARQFHYAFAHHYLRDFCRRDPRRFFTIMASGEERPRFLAWLWQEVEALLKTTATGMSASEIRATIGLIEQLPAVVLEMPPPVAPTEAHMVCAVMVSGYDPVPIFRWFTLEYGQHPVEGAVYTVFCEWADDTHRNHGRGPEPVVGEFVQAIREKLRAP